MKAIIFIGTQKSGSSREAIRAAEQLGYYTVLFTNRPSFLEKRVEFPDVHLMQLCNLNNLKELRGSINKLILKGIEISAIISFTDPYCYTASLLAEEFGVNLFSTESLGKMENKILSRQALSNTTYNPFFLILSGESPLLEAEIIDFLPAVMKSPSSAGSKDVFKVTTYKELAQFYSKLSEKYPNVPILIEEFLDGPQYLVEVVVIDAKPHIVAVVEQEITFNERFIVTGYNLMVDPPADLYESLTSAVGSIMKSFEMKSGPCHLEMRYINSQWKLIEINPRISGGGMNKLIEVGFGINLVEETLKLALRLRPNLQPKHKVCSFAQYVTVSETGYLDKVTGRGRASKCPGVKDVYIKPRKGALLTPPLSMGQRYAYVIATGENKHEAKKNAKYASSQIRFWMASSSNKQEEVIIEEETNDTNYIIKLLEKFKIYLYEQQESRNTVNRYLLNLFGYIRWFEDSYGKKGITFDRKSVLDYKSHLQNIKQDNVKGINQKLFSLKKFNEFLISESKISEIYIFDTDMIKAPNEISTVENEVKTIAP